MKILLYVKFEDLERYIRGEGIVASTKENKGYIFNGNKDELVNVSVDIDQIISTGKKELNGMVRGEFTYYEIQKSS